MAFIKLGQIDKKIIPIIVGIIFGILDIILVFLEISHIHFIYSNI